jgi:outer membrane receptor for ferrienterochelin and colicins
MGSIGLTLLERGFCMMKGVLGGLIAVSFMLIPGIVKADETAAASTEAVNEADQLMDMSLDDLMNITVTTTSKSEEKLSDAPGVISVVTRDEMERFGARTLKDVLMRMPSVNMSTTYIGDRSCISIRGDQTTAAQNHILLLINGRPVREAEEGGVKGEMYESFPIASIERIELIRGPGSVLYGSNAFSGVINVITKKAAINKATVKLGGGYPGEYNATGNAAYQIGDVGLVVGGQYKNAERWDLRFQANNTTFRDMSMPDNGFGTYGEVSYKGLRAMTSYDRWQNYFIMQKYIPPPPAGPVAGRHAYGDGQWDKWFNDLGYTHKFSDLYDISVNATYTQSWLAIDSFPAPNRNTYDLTGELTNFFHPIKNLNIIVGVLGNMVQGKEESGLPIATTLDTTQNMFSGYLQGDYRIIPELKVIAGVQANKAEGIDLDINPRAGLIWAPKENVNVKALYSSAFRAPSMMELYLNHPTLKGTDTLKPEKIQTVDLGVNIQNEKISIGINNFYSRITNIIYPRQITPPPSRYTNYGIDIPTTFIGMEVEGKLFITKELMLIGSGLYQQNTTGDSAGNMMPVPEASAKGGISYSANGLNASVFNIYEGKLDHRYDAPYNKTREAFDLLNASLKYELNRVINLAAPKITIELEGYNLLDQEVWLPATGQLKMYSVPAIAGASYYFGLTFGL